jgi:predicted Fe-Mo cluster-binding NifX family protein
LTSRAAVDLPDYYTTTAEGIARFLTQFRGIRELAPRDLADYQNDFRTGWEIPDLCTDGAIKLRVLLPALAPTAPVRLAVFPAPSVLTWPHLEKRGLLCLPTIVETASVQGTLDAIPQLLDHARILVNLSVTGQNIQDFEDEFASYWAQWDGTKATLNLICEPSGASREICAWHSTQGFFAAEDETTLRAWIVNRFGESTAKSVSCTPAPLIWLTRALRPSEYPSTIGTLRKSLNENPAQTKLLDAALLRITKEPKLVVLGLPTRSGVAFAGLVIQRPEGLANGFPKRAPDNVTLCRYNAGRITGAAVIRLDHAWVHGRDHNQEAAVLREKKVAIIGVGSVGSSAADLLAKAGIRTILLFDPETIESANSSRHLLGADTIGMDKAKAVAQDISRRLPHLNISFSRAFGATPEAIGAIQSIDLIICMTGNWPTEYMLDAIWTENRTLPPVMYAWTEPHAAAGHAVTFRTRARCLHCVLDDGGCARIPVTAWSQRTTLDIAACGGSFQPYGATQLAHTHALVAELAIDLLLNRTTDIVHRAWIGTRENVQRAGGTWDARWIAAFGDPGQGGNLVEVKVPSCDRCKAME